MMSDPCPPIPVGPFVATLAIVREDPPDPELNCIVCSWQHPCEWSIEIRGFGKRQYFGLHEKCRCELQRLGQCRDKG